MDAAVVKSWEPWSTPAKQFFMKLVVSETGYHVMWTDMMSLWSECVDLEAIKARTEQLNPAIEVPVTTVLSRLKQDTKPHHCTVSERQDGRLTVELNIQISGIGFVWKFNCVQQSQEELCNLFTRPLMTMTAELRRQQRLLVALVKRKDTEIEDYKMQSVPLTRRHLETKTFNEKTFLDTAYQSKGFDSVITAGMDMAFTTDNQNLYELIMKRKEELEDEKANTDDDASSGAGAAGDYAGGSVSTNVSPVKAKPSPQKPEEVEITAEEELSRREALAKRLAEQELRKAEKSKKKKKKLF